MTSINPELYKLSEKVASLTSQNILPFNDNAQPETREFLQKVIDILIDYTELCFNRDEKIVDFHHPDCLKELIDMKLPFKGQPLQALINDCANVLKYQVKSGHVHFMNQLSTGLDVISMAGEWLTATANANMFTYEVAPVFILMEHATLKKMRRIIGFTEGDSVMTPGGTIANLYGILLARYNKFPNVKKAGSSCLPSNLCVFTSDQSHYSIKLGCAVSGIGTDNCVTVPSDIGGRMIPTELERLICERLEMGHCPIMVNATAGTTVLGAFDPLNKISDICRKYNLWMHVDAAWGGGIMMSRRHRHPRFTCVERADSVTWNPHKLMGTVLQCATFHVKNGGLLKSCNKMTAEYLFMTDKEYDTRYDTGDRVIQCGRHNDVFKLWLQWRATGDLGFEIRVDNLMNIAQYQVKRIKEQSEKFYLLIEPESVNVCFWYIPKRLRSVKHDCEKEEELGKLCPIIKNRMMRAGTLMVGYQRDGKVPNFFRSIISQSAITEKDIDFMLCEIDRLGEDL